MAEHDNRLPAPGEKRAAQAAARRALTHKSLRFLIATGVPLVASYIHGFGSWFIYLMLGSTLGFTGDSGGKPLLRLGFMSIGPLSLLVGTAIGTFCHFENAEWLFFAVAIVTGFFYALVENRHGHMVMMPRFMGYGLVFGYAVAPISWFDTGLLFFSLAWAWVVSLLWDFVTGEKRPFSVPSLRRSIVRSYLKAPTRWRFAVSTGISVALALLTCIFIGNQHLYWTMLTMLIVLHYDLKNSASQITHRVTGTLLGAFFVITLVYLQVSPVVFFAASIAVTILRWPAFAVHSGLGTACITAFVLLLAELSAPGSHNSLPVLKDRLLATFIGCSFSLFTLDLDSILHRLVFIVRKFRRSIGRRSA